MKKSVRDNTRIAYSMDGWENVDTKDVYGGKNSGEAMTFSNIFGGILFGSIGFVAFIYGKKLSSFKPMALGLALMVFPYFIQEALWIYVIGGSLTAALYFFRD